MGSLGFKGLWFRRRWRVPLLLGLAVGAFLLQVGSAGAVPRHGAPRLRLTARGNTEMKVTDWFPGQEVTGFIADPGSSFDPATDPYPTCATTCTGFTAKNESFAGVIHGQPTTGAGATLNLYCIDIHTDTTTGIGYGLGSWDAGGVSPRVGYVARLLNDYYPHVPGQPMGLSDNAKAAAVQAAIWFFSDKYVLSTADPLHNTVVGIVNKAIADHPLIQPPPPTLTVDPPNASGPEGGAVGPFTVTSGTGEATVTATDGSMFSDAAGKVPIANGTTVPSGQKIWMRATPGSSTAVLQARATATVPSGNVYIYAGNNGVSDAQRLILAENATLTTNVQATADFLPPARCKCRRRSRVRPPDSRGKSSSTWPAPMVRTGPTTSSPPVRTRAPRRRLTLASRSGRFAPSPRHPTAAIRQRRWW